MVIKSRKMRWAGHVALTGEIGNAYKILVGRPRRRWEDYIRMDLREIMHLVQDRDQWRAVVNTVMNLRVPLKAGNFLTS
jgi:hypothetical protein